MSPSEVAFDAYLRCKREKSFRMQSGIVTFGSESIPVRAEKRIPKRWEIKTQRGIFVFQFQVKIAMIRLIFHLSE